MKQRGFALIAVVSVVAVLVIVGGVGFVMYNNFAAPKAADTHNHPSVSTPEHDMKTMQSVSSTKDLDQAVESLDDPSFDDDGQSDIDKDAAQF